MTCFCCYDDHCLACFEGFFFMSDCIVPNHHIYTRVAFMAMAGILCIIGITVIIGWYTHNVYLIQINQSFTPMQYNTALCFLAVGLYFVLYEFSLFSLFRIILCGIVLLISTITLFQYIADINLGIDNLFMDHYVLTNTSHRGRMAPSTAICFMLSGAAIIAFGRYQKSIIQAAYGTIFFFVFLSLIEFIMSDQGVIEQASLTRMAVHTMFCFFVISCALYMYSKRLGILDAFNVWDSAPVISFTILLSVTFFAWHASKDFKHRWQEQRFIAAVNDSQHIMMERFRLYEQALFGASGLIGASNVVSREEWKAYVDRLNLNESLPGINGIGYIDYIENEDLPRYIEDSRGDGFPEFNNFPQTEYEDKFIIRYIEPIDMNLKAVGLDIGFEKNRRAAAEKARDSGLPALTDKIELVQDNKKTAGFLFLIPDYKKDVRITSVEDRQKYIKGWVYAPFIARKFLSDFDEFSKGALYVTIHDGQHKEDEYIIFESCECGDDFDAMYSYQTHLKFGQNVWTLTWHATPDFIQESNNLAPKLVFLVGLFITIFVSGVFYILALLNGHTARSLRDSQGEFQLALQSSAVGMGLVSPEGRWLMVNDAISSMLGYEKKEFLESNFQNITHPEDLKEDLALVKKMLNRELETYTMEKRYIRKDGQIIWALLTVTLVWNEDGTPKYFISQVQDISQRKESEAEILRSNEELERFAYIASHDLQEPLRVISNFTGLLKEEYGDKLDDDANQYMDFSVDAANRMRALISDLLEYSRVGSDDTGFVKFQSRKHIQNALDNLNESIEQTGAKVVIGDMPELTGNPVRFSRLMQNLIGNGIKYRDLDKKPKIEVNAVEREQYWEFSIKDNGIGIGAEHLEQVFVIFKRLHNKAEYTGTGIGLAVCKKIVESFGGTIWVKSKVGRGSTFYFTWPKTKF